MADNTQIKTGDGGGDVIRDKDRGGAKTQIVGLDVNPAGAEVLGTGDATNGLDVDVTRVQGTVGVDANVAATRTALPGVSGAITAVAGRLMGYSIRETGGATAVFRLRDGTDATGPILDTVSLVANESVREWFGPGGKNVATGIYYEKVSGALEGAVFSK